MKVARRLAGLSLAIFCSQPIAFADYLNFAQYSISGQAAAGKPGRVVTKGLFGSHKTVTNNKKDPNQEVFDSQADATGAGGGGAHAEVHAVATAQGLSSSVRVFGYTTASNVGTDAGTGRLFADSVALAGWQDAIMITERNRPLGARIKMIGNLRLNGTLEATVLGPNDASHFGSAQVAASATMVSLPDRVVLKQDVAAAYDESDHSQKVVSPPVNSVQIPFFVKNGQPFPYEARLAVGVLAYSGAGGNCGAGGTTCLDASVISFMEGDFSHTMSWGGITSVTDAETGEILSDWTITADSGFDYTQPYSVPEPSLSVLLISLAPFCWPRPRRR